MLRLLSFVFWRESFEAPRPDSPSVGWAEKSLHFNCLFACSSPMPGNRSRQCSVSENFHHRNSRKSGFRWTPAAVLPAQSEYWSALAIVSCWHKVAVEDFCNKCQKPSREPAAPMVMRSVGLAESFGRALSVLPLLPTGSMTGTWPWEWHLPDMTGHV